MWKYEDSREGHKVIMVDSLTMQQDKVNLFRAQVEHNNLNSFDKFFLLSEKCLHLWPEPLPGPGDQEFGQPHHHPGEGQGPEECPGI